MNNYIKLLVIPLDDGVGLLNEFLDSHIKKTVQGTGWLSSNDSTNGGESSKFSDFIVCEVGDEFLAPIFEVTDKIPEMVILHREQFNDYIAVPRSVLDSGRHYMFGGNLLYTSDSRIGEAMNGWRG